MADKTAAPLKGVVTDTQPLRAAVASHCVTVSILSVLGFLFKSQAWQNVDKSKPFL